MRRRLLLVPALSLALLAAACSDDDQQTETGDLPSSTTTATDGTTTSTTTPQDGDRPTTGDAALITLDVHGGFVPVEVNVGNTAEVVVLADSRVISGAPTIAIYPGPALPAFQVSRADPAKVREVVEAFEALDPDADYSQGSETQVADAPDTTVTLHRGDKTVAITAYALGMVADSGPRRALGAVVDRINGLATGTGETPYEPTALRVHDITEQAGPMAQGGEGEPSGTVRDWPIPHDGSDCVEVTDPPRVAAALGALRQATQLDRWRTDAGERALVVVPHLPGDPGCPKD